MEYINLELANETFPLLDRIDELLWFSFIKYDQRPVAAITSDLRLLHRYLDITFKEAGLVQANNFPIYQHNLQGYLLQRLRLGNRPLGVNREDMYQTISQFKFQLAPYGEMTFDRFGGLVRADYWSAITNNASQHELAGI